MSRQVSWRLERQSECNRRPGMSLPKKCGLSVASIRTRTFLSPTNTAGALISDGYRAKNGLAAWPAGPSGGRSVLSRAQALTRGFKALCSKLDGGELLALWNIWK